MSANEEFPRGCIASVVQQASGIAASITIPAAPNISHVLDSVFAVVKEYAALGAATGYGVNFKDGAAVIPNEGGVLVLTTNNGDSDTFSRDGGNLLTTTAGNSLTVLLTAAPGAGIIQTIIITWHDI